MPNERAISNMGCFIKFTAGLDGGFDRKPLISPVVDEQELVYQFGSN